MLSDSGFDINITQQGHMYVVSGKDAAALHAKMQKVPPAASTLIVSDLKDGCFTLQKVTDVEKKAAGG